MSDENREGMTKDWERIISNIFDNQDVHPCEHEGCPRTVEYDDEPWCFTHSPDSGSSVSGYSYRAKHTVTEKGDR